MNRITRLAWQMAVDREDFHPRLDVCWIYQCDGAWERTDGFLLHAMGIGKNTLSG